MPSFSPLHIQSMAWLLPPFDHPFPILHTLCMGHGLAFSDDSHPLSTLSPPFIPLAWAKGGQCLASPTFCPHFPHPSYPLHGRRVGSAWLLPPFDHLFPILHTPCMGKGWAFSDDSHPLTTFSPPFIPLAWAKGGHHLASP